MAQAIKGPYVWKGGPVELLRAHLPLCGCLVEISAVGPQRLPATVLKAQREAGLVAGRHPLAALHLPCRLCKSSVLGAHLHISSRSTLTYRRVSPALLLTSTHLPPCRCPAGSPNLLFREPTCTFTQASASLSSPKGLYCPRAMVCFHTPRGDSLSLVKTRNRSPHVKSL